MLSSCFSTIPLDGTCFHLFPQLFSPSCRYEERTWDRGTIPRIRVRFTQTTTKWRWISTPSGKGSSALLQIEIHAWGERK
ncbi:MAG: hypothetical protein D6795_10130 [Deltaproteobacteria bacterium]|nr:MAG: hypothetical protein D6795_10130 [Deltaproteobacteria bacterium]